MRKTIYLLLLLPLLSFGQTDSPDGRRKLAEFLTKGFKDQNDPHNTEAWTTGHSDYILVFGGDAWTRADVQVFVKRTGYHYFNKFFNTYGFTSVCFKSVRGEYCYDKEEYANMF